jgi:hypothetical protein
LRRIPFRNQPLACGNTEINRSRPAGPPENRLHSGIGLHTPADVHYGRAHTIREARGRVLNAAYATRPERFVRKAPEPPKLPGTVWINKPEDKEDPAQ